MKFVIKKKYILIYIVIIFLLTAFFLTLFVINRISHLNNILDDENMKISNTLDTIVNLDSFITQKQLAYFIDSAILFEYFYKTDKKTLQQMLDNNQVYDFIKIQDIDGKHAFKNKNSWILSLNQGELLHNDSISMIIAFDEIAKKTFRIFAYPIKEENKTIAFIIAYLDINFLYDFYNIHLISKDGYLLNEFFANFDNAIYKNLSLLYPDEWQTMLSNNSGQIISYNGIFTYRLLENKIYTIQGFAIKQNPYFLVSIKPLNANDSPYFLNVHSFFKFIDFRYNIIYWIIGYIWIIGTSIITLYIVLNIIKNSNLASLDDLTGLFNRRSGFAKINKLINELSYSGLKQYVMNILIRFIYFRKITQSLHFCVIDIDGLKQVNDSLGHKYGDELIVTIAHYLKKSLNRGEFIIRMGGDEFVIVFINRDSADIEKYWNNLLNEFTEKNNTHAYKFNLKVSHGVVEYIRGNDILRCLIQADELMYKEKRLHKVNLFFN